MVEASTLIEVAFRARLGDLDQHVALLLRVTLHGLDEIGNEIGAALVLVEHLAPRGLRAFFFGRDGVDAATGELESEKSYGQGSNDTSAHGNLLPGNCSRDLWGIPSMGPLYLHRRQICLSYGPMLLFSRENPRLKNGIGQSG